MANESATLTQKAFELRRRLEEQGQREDAEVIEQLLTRLLEDSPRAERPFYTTTEAARLVGVTAQTIKNWVSRGILKGYRLGGRIVIPRAELDDYKPIADALKALDPTPSDEEIVEMIRAGRRRFVWPTKEQLADVQ